MSTQIFSVHCGDEWSDIQSRQFGKFTSHPYQIHRLEGVGVDMVGEHLRGLQDAVARASGELAVVVDSDAFPIAKWQKPVLELLETNKFVAIQRTEHHRKKKCQRPHPAFIAWKPKEFTPRFVYVESFGGPTVAGYMRANWSPLTRTNSLNIDPLLCGIYGDMIYHHGFGSRPPDGYRTQQHHNNINRKFWDDPEEFVEWIR